MSQELLVAIIQFAMKFGLDAALAIMQAAKSSSIDDAIAALQAAKAKSAQTYLDEAKAKL